MLKGLKNIVFKANLDLVKHGLVIHTWGNVSGRDKESGMIVIKPSGVDYESMKPEDMVIIDPEGKVVEGKFKPSTDAPTHLLLYNSWPEIGGVVHTHSSYATSWAQAGKAIPPFGTTHADHYYGEVPCTRLLTDNEIETDYEINTGKVIVEKMGKVDPLSIPSVLVCSHGPFCWGTDADNAVITQLPLKRLPEWPFIQFSSGKMNQSVNHFLTNIIKENMEITPITGKNHNKIFEFRDTI